MAADAGIVKKPTGNLKTELDSLAGKFTDEVIYSEGKKMSDAGTSIKDVAETNCQTICEEAENIQFVVNNISLE